MTVQAVTMVDESLLCADVMTMTVQKIDRDIILMTDAVMTDRKDRTKSHTEVTVTVTSSFQELFHEASI